MADLSFFMHGGLYPETVGVRPQPCDSCAFSHHGKSVRPLGFTLVELIEGTAEFDDFVCHCEHEGKTHTCYVWARLNPEKVVQKPDLILIGKIEERMRKHIRMAGDAAREKRLTAFGQHIVKAEKLLMRIRKLRGED